MPSYRLGCEDSGSLGASGRDARPKLRGMYVAVRLQAVQCRVTFPPGASSSDIRSGCRLTDGEPHEGQTSVLRSRSAAIKISASGALYSL